MADYIHTDDAGTGVSQAFLDQKRRAADMLASWGEGASPSEAVSPERAERNEAMKRLRLYDDDDVG